MATNDRPVAELIGEVRKLEGTNSALTRYVKELQGEVVALDERMAANTTALQKRARLILALVLVVAVALAAFVVVSLYAKQYQNCVNKQNDARARTTQLFLVAERAKVAGQIAGLKEIAAGQVAHGVADFTAASERYLAYVDNRQAQLKVGTPSC